MLSQHVTQRVVTVTRARSRRWLAAGVVALLAVLSSACSIRLLRFTDGPATTYLAQPIPAVERPVARTASLETIYINTASSHRPELINEMTYGRMTFLDEDVGRRVADLLQMSAPYDEYRTRRAIELVAGARLARPHPLATEELGELGDANIEWQLLRRWIVRYSGAVGRAAPAGTHLRVVLLRFFDAKSFNTDSRTRIAALIMLEGPDGRRTVVEGSDTLFCINQCNTFPPKTTERPILMSRASADVRARLLTPEAVKARKNEGLETIDSLFFYLLFHHGVNKLARPQHTRTWSRQLRFQRLRNPIPARVGSKGVPVGLDSASSASRTASTRSTSSSVRR